MVCVQSAPPFVQRIPGRLDRLLSDTLNAPSDRSAVGSEDMEWDNDAGRKGHGDTGNMV
jgi:hypothetical protein